MERDDTDPAPPPELSLTSHAELLLACLSAASPATVVEIGALRGEFTRMLLAWSGDAGAKVIAVEPEPGRELVELCESHPELQLVRETSLEALKRMAPADAVIVDGDHNYHTVSEELRLIAASAGRGPLPLLAFHDVGWPHARRDTYYAPERIPEQHRQPLARDALLAPGEPAVASAGMFFPWAAREEGGPRNGVLTAIEDFVAEREGLQLALVPAFFGLGLLWERDASWAGEVASLVEPWDRSPLLERLEAGRLEALVDSYRLERQRELLRALTNSRAFEVAEALSRLRQRGEPVYSRAEIKRLLGDG